MYMFTFIYNGLSIKKNLQVTEVTMYSWTETLYKAVRVANQISTKLNKKQNSIKGFAHTTSPCHE